MYTYRKMTAGSENPPLYPFFPVESPELLTELMATRRFAGSQTRLNVARGKETFVHKGGREFLVDKINSDVVRTGPIFKEVRRHHPWVEQLTLNKNLLCTRHTDRNEGTSLICFLGVFFGGRGALRRRARRHQAFSRKKHLV